jgi:hypothetical protein
MHERHGALRRPTIESRISVVVSDKDVVCDRVALANRPVTVAGVGAWPVEVTGGAR